MPEIAVHSHEGLKDAPPLDLSYTETGAAFGALDDSLDDLIHDKNVVDPYTLTIISKRDGVDGCERIVAYMTEQYAAAKAENDHAAEWSAIGFES
jgi:hypothetical protein